MKYTELSTENLKVLSENIARDLIDIRYQIDTAKSNSAKGEYSDPEWFRKANYALKMKGLEHQRVLQELARRNREDKKERANSFGERFIKAARESLPEDTFRAIFMMAQE